jgi:hypothetical protein
LNWIVIVIILIVGFIIEYRAEEMKRLQKDETERKEAERRFSKALTQTGVSNLIVYGHFRGPADPAEPEPDLIALEKEKWEALNAGRFLAAVLVGSASAMTHFFADGTTRVETTGRGLVTDFSITPSRDPYTPQGFQIARPSPDTAIVNYQVVNGYIAGNVTAILARRGGHWVTVSYQISKT